MGKGVVKLDFFEAMKNAGWAPAITLFGKIPYWVHENGTKIYFWRAWQVEYAQTGKLPPIF